MSSPRIRDFPALSVTALRPWEAGNSETRWNGYFIEPGSEVLRNLLGVEDLQVLADAENDLVEFRT